MGVFRTPDDRFENLPGWNFEPRYLEWEGMRIHYVDEGIGDPIVLFHGEPTWGYLYRKMIGPLVDAGHRVIAYDHIGFGGPTSGRTGTGTPTTGIPRSPTTCSTNSVSTTRPWWCLSASSTSTTARSSRYDLSEDASTETAMVFGELYRRNDEWKFRAVGQGYASGLAGIARDYGVRPSRLTWTMVHVPRCAHVV